MKKSALAVGATAVVALMAAGSVLAQTAPDRSARASGNDARISRAEFVDARVARLTALDTNGDGSISADERRAASEARRTERTAARFAALDKDGNGAISREEFTAPREARADRGERGGGHQMRGQRGPRGDHAGHRGLRGGERAGRGEARGPQTIADVRTRLTAQFDRLDTDRDGYITAEERSAARQAQRSERQAQRGERQDRRGSRGGNAPASPSASASE